MSTDKEFKILSIDGGGTKGLYSLYILNALERLYCLPDNKLLSDYFDMICGTSVGSIIAVCIALKIPTSTIISTFEADAPSVFPTDNHCCLFGWLFRLYYGIKQLCGDKYDVTSYKNLVEQFVQNKTMKDVNNLLCIPSYCISNKQNCIFKNTRIEFEINVEDDNVKLSDVILASSAAPTYFPPHKIGDKYYTDGGLWANNPSMVGIVESLKYFIGDGKRYKSYQLLSIGNLCANQPITINHPNIYFNCTQILNILSLTLDGNRDCAEYFCKKMEESTHGTHLRIVNKDTASESLDNASPSFLELLKTKSAQDLKMIFENIVTKHKLDNIFATRKTYGFVNSCNVSESSKLSTHPSSFKYVSPNLVSKEQITSSPPKHSDIPESCTVRIDPISFKPNASITSIGSLDLPENISTEQKPSIQGKEYIPIMIDVPSEPFNEKPFTLSTKR